VDIDLAAHVFGIESQVHTDCRNEFDIRFNEDGGGKVADMLVSADGNSTPDCGVVKACNSEANPVQGHAGTHGNATRSVWNAQLNEIANGVLSSTVRTCFRTGNGLMPECEGDIVLAVSESTEDLLEAIANDTRIGTSGCEVTGHYDITEEVGEDVHINHL
jgi:hypothetical protein